MLFVVMLLFLVTFGNSSDWNVESHFKRCEIAKSCADCDGGSRGQKCYDFAHGKISTCPSLKNANLYCFECTSLTAGDMCISEIKVKNEVVSTMIKPKWLPSSKMKVKLQKCNAIKKKWNYIERKMPSSIQEANAEFPRRKKDLVKSFLLHFATKNQTFDGKNNIGWRHWSQDAYSELPIVGSALYLFAYPEQFTTEEKKLFYPILSGLPDSLTYEQHLTSFQKSLLQYFKTIKQFETVGTAHLDRYRIFKHKEQYWKGSCGNKIGGDYDFLLQQLINVLYLYKDHHTILTNEMIWEILSHQYKDDVTESGVSVVGTKVSGAVILSGQNVDDFINLNYKGKNVGFEWKISQSETENHILGLHTWRYLIQEYMEWVSGLSTAHPRYDARIKRIFENDLARYKNTEQYEDFLKQILSRTLYLGLFETNAKIYEVVSFGAIQTFSSFANVLNKNKNKAKVQLAAQNTLDYLSGKFAFQSFEGKRSVSMRRNWSYKSRYDFSHNEYMPNVLGVLTGAYVFDDDIGYSDYVKKKLLFDDKMKEVYLHKPYHYANIGQKGKFALWSALLNYRVPEVIHDYMLHKHNGYWARFQSKYTTEHMPLEKTSLQIGTPSDPKESKPKYFNEDGSIFFEPWYLSTEGPVDVFRPVTQFVFAGKDYINTSGGYFRDYYKDKESWGPFYKTVQAKRVYNNISKPYTIIGKGLYAFSGADIRSFEAKNITMRGQYENTYYSKNLWTYKNFSLGYKTDGKHDFHLDWPQSYPVSWERNLVKQFDIQRASFKVFDFRNVKKHPLQGKFLLLAKMSKSKNRGRHREYARGFWEVIPGESFSNAQDLQEKVIALNPSSYFNNNASKSYFYKTTVGDKIQMDYLVGATVSDQSIQAIWDKAGNKVDLSEYFILNRLPNMADLPLLSVWEVDEEYQYTGVKLAWADKGKVVFKNPHLNSVLTLDATDYKNPKRLVEPFAK